jgi:hypothetical protein
MLPTEVKMQTIDFDDIVWRLACLASLPYQERYVLNGTTDEYVVDHELIDDVDALKFRIRRPENATVLDPNQRVAVEELLSAIERTEVRDDIREDAGWSALRLSAAAALKTFGMNVEEMSVEDVERLAA